MKAALGLVVAGGLAIGLFAPIETPVESITSDPAAPPPVSQRKKPAQSPVPPPAARWGGETRLVRAANGHFYATARINGQPIELVVDTGATTVALTVADARRAGIAVDPTRFEVVGTGASGAVMGQPVTIRTIALDTREVRNLEAVVLDGLEVSLLGQSFLGEFAEVRMAGDEMVLK